MRAKEYYAQYKERILSADEQESLKAIAELIHGLSMESREMISKRKVTNDCGAVSILREVNDKYNAVCRMFEQEYGASPIKRDGFITYWKAEIPELDKRMKMRGTGRWHL